MIFATIKLCVYGILFELAKYRAYLPQARVVRCYRALETVLSARHPYQDSHFWESSDDLDIALSAMRLLDVEDWHNAMCRSPVRW